MFCFAFGSLSLRVGGTPPARVLLGTINPYPPPIGKHVTPTRHRWCTHRQAHSSAVRAMSWSHSGNTLISGDHNGNIKYWQVSNFAAMVTCVLSWPRCGKYACLLKVDGKGLDPFRLKHLPYDTTQRASKGSPLPTYGSYSISSHSRCEEIARPCSPSGSLVRLAILCHTMPCCAMVCYAMLRCVPGPETHTCCS